MNPRANISVRIDTFMTGVKSRPNLSKASASAIFSALRSSTVYFFSAFSGINFYYGSSVAVDSSTSFGDSLAA